jgi:hypothetical protein
MENLGLGNSDDSDDSEESSDEDGAAGGAGRSAEPEMSRAERKAMKKAQAGKKPSNQQTKALPPQSESEEESGEESEEPDRMLQSGPLARTGPSRKEK